MPAIPMRAPDVPASHPVLAYCSSDANACEIEEWMRHAGIAYIRIDREAASLRTGRPVEAFAVILVSREDYPRACGILSRRTSGDPTESPSQPA